MVQDDSAKVKALCSDHLRKTYYDYDLKKIIHNDYSVFMFFLFTLVVPLISITVMAAIARSWQKVIHIKITRAANYANITGVVISGFFITVFITSLDFASVFYSYIRTTEVDEALHEFEANKSAKYFKEHELNFLITIMLTIYDSAILLVSLSSLMYVCVIELKCCGEGKCFYCSLQSFKWFFNTFFFLIFGTRNHQHSWDSPQPVRINSSHYSNGVVNFNRDRIANNRLIWILMFSTTAPAFSLAGHLGFILISWVINPSQATAMFIQDITILVFLFIMTRQCYLIHRKYERDVKWCLICWPLYDVLSVLCCIDVCYRRCRQELDKSHDLDLAAELQPTTCRQELDKSHDLAAELQPNTGYSFKAIDTRLELGKELNASFFNSKAFCIAFAWSWALILLIGLTMVAFLELPIATLSLPNYLLNILQILLIVLPLLITYKILSTSESEVLKFMKNMRSSYIHGGTQKSKKWSEYDDIETIGDLAGEVIKKLVTPPQNN